MFTKWYYRCIAGKMVRELDSSSYDYPIKNYKGSTLNNTGKQQLGYVVEFLDDSLKYGIMKSKPETDTSGVVFGNGTAAPTPEDYQLSGDHFVNYTMSCDAKYHPDEQKIVCLYTLTNTGDTSFTVSEIGVVSGSGVYVMAIRELLDAPITIPAGGVGQVTLTINFGDIAV